MQQTAVPRFSLRTWLEHRLLRSWWRPEADGLATALRPLAWIYERLARRVAASAQAAGGPRNAQRPHPAVPVLVVGNIIVGGAGKTPTVMALVQAFTAAGRRPGVVTRGYGRQGTAMQGVQVDDRAERVGDEALLIRRRTGVPVWVGRDRAAAAAALSAAHPEVDVILSDDGLQHHHLRRQAELLVFDDRGIGNGLLLPAGPLRQALPAALHAHQRVLYTGTRLSTTLPGCMGQRRLAAAWPLAAWLRGDASQAVPLQTLRGRPLLAVAGLAAPQRFFAMLQAQGLDCTTLALPDHHPNNTQPWPDGTLDVLTTEKDATKLSPERLQGTRVWVLPLDFRLPAGLADDLLSLLPLPNPNSNLPPP